MNLIPKPKVWIPKDGKFVFSNKTVCNAKPLEAFLKALPDGVANEVSAVKDPSLTLKEEGYTLDVTEKKIEIRYRAERGLINACSTLRVLAELDVKGAKEVSLRCCRIEDEPRFGWRGVLLDEARHFFGKAAVLRLIDRMSVVKLNVLHWHLNDDQGWRVEIAKYPELTTVGSTRPESQVGGWTSLRYDKTPVSGYYTKADIAEILAYAERRNVTVVPEIDFPGHFTAVLAAYPELSCSGEKTEVRTKFGISKRIACGGNDKVYAVLKDILEEVAETFPAEYFHIGGDEAPKDEWKKCPACRKKIAELGLTGEEELQGYITNFAVGVLSAKGKVAMGWNEVLAAENIDNKLASEYWTPWRDARAEKYLAEGGKTVIARQPYFYFDYTYAMTPLRKTYAFEKGMSYLPFDSDAVLGLEGAAWTEWIEDERKLDFQIYPRLFALAECAWSAKCDDYPDFKARLAEFNRIADALNIGYADIKIADPKNPITRAYRTSKWGLSDQNVEYRINQKRRS